MPDYGVGVMTLNGKIKIDGVTMPPLQSLTIDKKRIWSSKTGRTANGSMKGDIVAYKDTLNIVFVPLSNEDSEKLDKAIHSAFFNVEYIDPGTGKTRKAKFYADAPSYPVYSYADELPRYVGVGISLIEQ